MNLHFLAIFAEWKGGEKMEVVAFSPKGSIDITSNVKNGKTSTKSLGKAKTKEFKMNLEDYTNILSTLNNQLQILSDKAPSDTTVSELVKKLEENSSVDKTGAKVDSQGQFAQIFNLLKQLDIMISTSNSTSTNTKGLSDNATKIDKSDLITIKDTLKQLKESINVDKSGKNTKIPGQTAEIFNLLKQIDNKINTNDTTSNSYITTAKDLSNNVTKIDKSDVIAIKDTLKQLKESINVDKSDTKLSSPDEKINDMLKAIGTSKEPIDSLDLTKLLTRLDLKKVGFSKENVKADTSKDITSDIKTTSNEEIVTSKKVDLSVVKQNPLESSTTPLKQLIAEIQSFVDMNKSTSKVEKPEELEVKGNVVPEKLLSKVSRIEQILEQVVKGEVTKAKGTDITTQDKDEKGNKILKGILKTDNSGNQDKVSNFLTHLSAAKDIKTTIVSDKPEVNKNSFTSDIIKAVKYMDDNNIKNLSVKINPKEMGELIIKVTSENGIVKVSITASNKDTYNLLNSNLSDVKGTLNNQEITVHNYSQDIYNGDTTFFSKGSSRNNEGQTPKHKIKTSDDLILDDIHGFEEIEDTKINILA